MNETQATDVGAVAQKALDAYVQHMPTQLDDLCALVRIPSVSFPGFDTAHVVDCAEAVASLLRRRGAADARLVHLGDAHPYVLASHHVNDALPTLLLYAHYDVQPPGELAAWHSDPYQPTERDGRLYGRGAADDKAGIAVHTGALASYLQGGNRPPVNLKIIFEGEEETGSAHLEAFMGAHAQALRAQAMVLTDTANYDVGVPGITVSLRGLVTVDVEVRSIAQALHSGMWGGPVPDAAMALAKMLAGLTDAAGQVAIDGIDAAYPGPPAAARADLAELPATREPFAKQAGLLPGVHTLGAQWPEEHIWRRPSLAINAMQASSEADARNILVHRAWARVGLRVAPGCDAKQAALALETALRKSAPWGVAVALHRDGAQSGWQTETHHPAFAACARALRQGYGASPVLVGCGGSIPFVKPMCAALGDIPALLLGVEDPYTRAHGDNESLHLADWHSATRSAIHLYAELAAIL